MGYESSGISHHTEAAVFGENTADCGGGWHRGDRPARLTYSDLELHVPDKVLYRRDGSNYRGEPHPV